MMMVTLHSGPTAFIARAPLDTGASGIAFMDICFTALHQFPTATLAEPQFLTTRDGFPSIEGAITRTVCLPAMIEDHFENLLCDSTPLNSHHHILLRLP